MNAFFKMNLFRYLYNFGVVCYFLLMSIEKMKYRNRQKQFGVCGIRHTVQEKLCSQWSKITIDHNSIRSLLQSREG